MDLQAGNSDRTTILQLCLTRWGVDNLGGLHEARGKMTDGLYPLSRRRSTLPFTDSQSIVQSRFKDAWKLLRGPCPLLLLLCSHPLHHVGPYIVSCDEAIAVSVQPPELFFVKGHPFAFADPPVMIGIHVLEHPIDHLLHSRVPVRRRSSSRRGRLLCLCKKETAVNHKYDTNHDRNYFPSSHPTFLSSRRQN